MIPFKSKKLDNDLTVLVHEDSSTPMAVVNILYDVGARDESPERTGFAHLFEHLMFAGSANVPDFDDVLERLGAENNAFTNNDFTNYYEVLPAANLETALFLEADRMHALDINDRSLEIQRKVVMEELKEHYINQPYGDAWHLLRGLAYKKHPYRWPTIGLTLDHIDRASLEEVKSFYRQHYRPDRAYLAVAGGVKAEEVIRLAEKHFGGIEPGHSKCPPRPAEPEQQELRLAKKTEQVPGNVLYAAWHMDQRMSPGFYAADLITDLLANGKSARLYRELVSRQHIFVQIDAYTTGEADPGLLVIEGRLSPGISFEQALEALDDQIGQLKNQPAGDTELQKVKNKVIAYHEFEKISLMNRAFNLCYFEWLGEAALWARENDKYAAVSAGEIQETACKIFSDTNCSQLWYQSQNLEA